MKKIIAVLVTVLTAVGFEWGFALSRGMGAGRSDPQSSDTLFRTAITTLDYQGQKSQNRVQTVMLSRTDRQKNSTEATYTLSGEAGVRVGKDGQPAYYQSPPVRLKRDLSTDLLSNGQQSPGLDRWVGIINRTLAGLTHKHMTSGEWEEVLDLKLGAGFPETIRARFWAEPLPEPENRWVLITVETGLLSFVPLDRRYEEIPVYGRYRGVLVYAPAEEDAFRQSGAAIDFYRGEERFRIAHLQFAADAEGTRLFPALDVREFLGLTEEPLSIAAQGAFPSWSSQSSLVFDILNAAMMTAAEGATNGEGFAGIEQGLIDLINHDYNAILKFLGKQAAEEYLGNWMKALRFSANLEAQGAGTALWELAKEVAEDALLAVAVASGLGLPVLVYKVAKFEMDLGKAILKEMARDIAAARALRNRPKPRLRPLPRPQPQAPPVQLRPESKPGEEKPSQPPKKPGSALKIVGTILGIAAGVVGGLYLAKLLKGVSEDTGDTSGTETWTGTFTQITESYTYGEHDCTYTKTGSITFNLNRSGSNITGTNTVSNLKDNIVQLDPWLVCPPWPLCEVSTGGVKATVNSQGNYVFSSLSLAYCIGGYKDFVASVSGKTMTGSATATSSGNIGPVSSKDALTFTVTKQ